MKKLLLVAILFLGIQSSPAQSATTLNQDAANWVKTHEAQLQQTTDLNGRRNQLVNLAPAALAAGDKEKAKIFAEELIELGEKTKSSPGFGPGNYGQAVHTGKTVLGLIAVDAGDIQSAKDNLLASARIEGSPVLKTFGPGMLLAQRLLEKGERKAVIEYFDLCAKFWANQRGRLDQWKAAVEKGEMPDFGTNLKTGLDTWRVIK